MTLRYKVNRTYSEYDYSELEETGEYTVRHSFEYVGREMDLRDVLRELEDCSELSDSSNVLNGWTWATGYSEDYCTRIQRAESVHIYRHDGQRLPAHQLRRIYRLANLLRATPRRCA